jgi:hypothetical protein
VSAERQLGERLSAFLTPRTLAAWIGTDRISALPPLLARRTPAAPTYAAALFSLLVAGDEVEVDARRDEIDLLRMLDLIDFSRGRARARVAILPLGRSLLVCDRLDAPDEPEHVCWPDDSSYHLARCLPRAGLPTWVDVGCGSAFAALLRPDVAGEIMATDLNDRAVRYARLGLAISGVEHVQVAQMNLVDTLDKTYALASCNAPIPSTGGPYRAHWHTTDDTFMPKMLEALGQAAPVVVVHAALDALRPIVPALPGQRIVVAYTPDDLLGFGVLWWRPEAAQQRLVWTRRALTATRPHLTFEDLVEAGATIATS